MRLVRCFEEIAVVRQLHNICRNYQCKVEAPTCHDLPRQIPATSPQPLKDILALHTTVNAPSMHQQTCHILTCMFISLLPPVTIAIVAAEISCSRCFLSLVSRNGRSSFMSDVRPVHKRDDVSPCRRVPVPSLSFSLAWGMSMHLWHRCYCAFGQPVAPTMYPIVCRLFSREYVFFAASSCRPAVSIFGVFSVLRVCSFTDTILSDYRHRDPSIPFPEVLLTRMADGD